MKKAVKTLVSLLETNREEESLRTEKYLKSVEEKSPKTILLACPQSMRMLTVDRESVYTVESYGATIFSNEATLDHAVRRLQIPLLCIVTHHHCGALEHSPKINQFTDAEKALYDHVAAGLEGAPKTGLKRSLQHLDAQVAAALSRYGDVVKSGKLAVVGIYCDESGKLFLTNYNGLKGKDALGYSLPDVDAAYFI
ncbi:MAG: hypothetical protein IKV45_02705 [Firmicutes bacterium]|nr:hypothetical protein [Bacillota bacterium]